MSVTHLTTGSQQPLKVDGKLRLYSAEFCPYAQRVRLVLKAKNIPHDIVNISLSHKPEWYSKIHPEEKVPALDTGTKIIIESLDIVEFLDEQYPKNPLYPLDPEAKKRDQEVIKKLSPLSDALFKCVLGHKHKTLAQCMAELVPQFETFETELAARGSPFFGGRTPGMVDYLLWPTCERLGVLAIAYGEKLPFDENQLQFLKNWNKAMFENPICRETYHEPEEHWIIVQQKLNSLQTK